MGLERRKIGRAGVARSFWRHNGSETQRPFPNTVGTEHAARCGIAVRVGDLEMG